MNKMVANSADSIHHYLGLSNGDVTNLRQLTSEVRYVAVDIVEFVARYMLRSNMLPCTLQGDIVTKPFEDGKVWRHKAILCDCAQEACDGWQMVAEDCWDEPMPSELPYFTLTTKMRHWGRDSVRTETSLRDFLNSRLYYGPLDRQDWILAKGELKAARP